jgi:hypothetical protein
MRLALIGIWLSAVAAMLPSGEYRVLMASASGPIPARTGGFGEMTCYQCHWDNPLNDPAGRLSLAGAPDTYIPGERYLITVAIAHPELVKGGFQMSARFEDGRNAGAFHNSDPLTEPIRDEQGRITYIQHTARGSVTPTTGESRWTVEWAAPADGGAVSFHLAGNASNGDASPLGDFIYTASAISRRR